MDNVLTVEAIAHQQQERERFDEAIDDFARAFAADCGEPISPQWYFDDWELFAGRVDARYEFMDQCGGNQRIIQFPALAMSDEVERNAAIASRVADIEVKAYNECQQQIASAQAESDRALAKIERLQQEREDARQRGMAAAARGEISG